MLSIDPSEYDTQGQGQGQEKCQCHDQGLENQGKLKQNQYFQ